MLSTSERIDYKIGDIVIIDNVDGAKNNSIKSHLGDVFVVSKLYLREHGDMYCDVDDFQGMRQLTGAYAYRFSRFDFKQQLSEIVI